MDEQFWGVALLVAVAIAVIWFVAREIISERRFQRAVDELDRINRRLSRRGEGKIP